MGNLRSGWEKTHASSTRHGRACPGHPRPCLTERRKTWMPGTSPGMTAGKSAAPHRRHLDLVAAAGAAVDFLAGAELQVLAQADPHLAEPRPVAGHGDCRTAQPGIDLDEGVLDVGGGNGLRLGQ